MCIRDRSDDAPPNEVVRKVKTASDYFNTLAKDAREPKLIQAIIDENIKAVDGSRVSTSAPFIITSLFTCQ